MADAADETAETSPILPMEAKSVAALPVDGGWQFEPKWDGFRCLAFKSGQSVRLFAKSGKPLHRYFPEVAEAVRALEADEFVLDGELVIPYEGALSFDALGMRLHPAESRIRKLSKEMPAKLVVFDLLIRAGEPMTALPLTARRAALEAFLDAAKPGPGVRLSPYTRDRAEAENWLEQTGGSLDGVVAKRLDGAYESGARAMLKVKRQRTADCVVAGFRYGANSTSIGSLLLGLFGDDGLLHHVGHCSSFSAAERKDLTPKLEALRGPPGFTGHSPGGPSRWSTERTGEFEPLRTELVVEVTFDQVSGGRIRHGTSFVRWRPDKAPGQCRFDQLDQPPLPAALMAGVID